MISNLNMVHNENREAAERKKEAIWHSQKPLMDSYYQGAEGHMSSIKNLKEAFFDKKRCICCMDEGTAHIKMDGKLGMAGSGILYPADSWKDRLNKVAAICIASGVPMVTSHEGCGAAALAAKRDRLNLDNPDEYGKKWSKELQKCINKLRKTEAAGESDHISSKDMARPAEFHNARVVWFDVTGKFNPDKLENQAPPGFLINHAIKKLAKTREEENYSFSELSVAIAIAFGNHGFGKSFDGKNKFVITIVAADLLQYSKTKLELESFIATKLPVKLKELNPEITDEEINRIVCSVKIDYFFAPKK